MRERFISYLRNREIHHKEINGLIVFSVNSLNYVFEDQERDPNYFRLMLPGVGKWNDENIQIITDLNWDFKVAKLIKTGEYLTISAESFVYSEVNIDVLFNRIITLLGDVIPGTYKKRGQQ